MSMKDNPREKRPCNKCNDSVIDSQCETHRDSHSLCYRCHLKNKHRVDWDGWKTDSEYSLSGPDLGPTPREMKLEAMPI